MSIYFLQAFAQTKLNGSHIHGTQAQRKGILKFKLIFALLAMKDESARQSYRKEIFTGHAERPMLHAESPAFVW